MNQKRVFNRRITKFEHSFRPGVEIYTAAQAYGLSIHYKDQMFLVRVMSNSGYKHPGDLVKEINILLDKIDNQ